MSCSKFAFRNSVVVLVINICTAEARVFEYRRKTILINELKQIILFISNRDRNVQKNVIQNKNLIINERKIEMQASKTLKNILFSFQLFNYQYGEETSIILRLKEKSELTNFKFYLLK